MQVKDFTIATFQEFCDKTGFSIKENNRTIDFFYDPFHGWFDEYSNYYNEYGNLDNPNSKSLEFWEKIRHECFYCFFIILIKMIIYLMITRMMMMI